MRVIIGDVETSDLSSDAGVVEIAWAETDTSLTILNTAYSLINPGRPISPAASGVHGLLDRHVECAPTLDEFVGSAFDDGEILFAAHNAKYDLAFFGPRIKNLVGTLCTLKMARLIYPEAPDHKLQTLRYYLALEGGDSHSAAGDVEVLVNLIKRMVADSNMNLIELWHLSQRPVMIDKISFGKHKGKNLRDLPRDYVRWLLTLPDLDDNLRFSLEAL